MSGADVTSLQTFFNNEYSNFFSSYITGYFGSLTQAAVAEWQSDHGVVSSGSPQTTGWGAVGPKTRAAIKTACASTQTPVTPSTPVAVPIPTGGGGSSGGGGGSSGGGSGGGGGNPPPPSSCTLNGATVASGASQTFYSDAAVSSGDSCANYAQTRTCTNGTLSGDSSYQYSTCAVGNPNACSFNSHAVASGASVTAYQSSTVPYGQTCTSQSRMCSNGDLSGTYQYASCSVSAPAPTITYVSNSGNGVTGSYANLSANSQIVVINETSGQEVPDISSTVSGSGTLTLSGLPLGTFYLEAQNASGTYLAQSVSFTASGTTAPAPAISSFTASPSSITQGQSATLSWSASNATSLSISGVGTVTGSSVTVTPSQTTTYTLTATNSAGSVTAQSTVTVSLAIPAPSCTFNGQTIQDGASVTAYQSSSVASGQQCVSETRTCTNGALSGSYQSSSCTVLASPVVSTSTLPPQTWSIQPDPVSGISPFTEIPAWVLQSGTNNFYTISNGSSFFYSTYGATPDNLILSGTGSNRPFQSGTSWGMLAATPSIVAAVLNNDPSLASENPWRRSYNGIFSVFSYGSNLFTINHGENKNYTDSNGVFSQGTINTDVGESCTSTNASDCWPAYNAFIFSTTYDWVTSVGWTLSQDSGPIIWPGAGYLYQDSGSLINKASYGVRQPTALLDNGYVYVFYMDTAFATTMSDAEKQILGTSGRGQEGVKVARAPLSGAPDNLAGTFMTLYQGTFSQPSLPSGFTTASFQAELSEPGPRGDLLLDPSLNVQRFAVAKVANQDVYVAAVYYIPYAETDMAHVGLSFSRDLIHWTTPISLNSAPLDQFAYNYALIIDGNAQSSVNPIDPTNFLVYGVGIGNDVTTVMRVSLDLSRVQAMLDALTSS